MEFDTFLSKLSEIRTISSHNSYDGANFQLIMTPKERLKIDTSSIKNSKKAGVLALFYPKNNKTHLLLTLRANYKGTHSAQISFPGGKFDKKDSNLLQTALRETTEEVGVKANLITPSLALSKVYIPPSNFWVSPFIATTNITPTFNKNYEVAKIIEIPILELLNDNNVSIKKTMTSYNVSIDAPCFIFNNHIVWGATAMILSEIKELLKMTII